MIALNELEGEYEITYQSTPPMPDWYEIGTGAAEIRGTILTGQDGMGVLWSAHITQKADGTLEFKAVLDPSKAPLNVGLINKKGQMTREMQHYEGELKATKVGEMLILRTAVKQGPITINVQFKKS